MFRVRFGFAVGAAWSVASPAGTVSHKGDNPRADLDPSQSPVPGASHGAGPLCSSELFTSLGPMHVWDLGPPIHFGRPQEDARLGGTRGGGVITALGSEPLRAAQQNGWQNGLFLSVLGHVTNVMLGCGRGDSCAWI